MSENAKVSVHWSFWLVGGVGLLFNLAGCMNFLSQMNAESLAAMPDVYRSIAESRPAWATGSFAVAVFGGSLGCVLLLMRRSIAFYVFAVALLGAVIAQIPVIGMADIPIDVWLGWLSQVVVVAFLIWYSKQSQRKAWIK